VIGRTNMTEFAYSGIGINPHYGTPKGAWQRSVGPCARRLVLGRGGVGRRRHGASARSAPTPAAPAGIPAAYNGIVGYKPTQRRVPLDGARAAVVHASTAIGPLARTVACCAALDAVLADQTFVTPLQPRPDQGDAARGADHGRARRPRRCRWRGPSSARWRRCRAPGR
jgi:aspartyl-tRNA(Asn)/glutamyl-tRNA(Gln) amidotransferase subunit A